MGWRKVVLVCIVTWLSKSVHAEPAKSPTGTQVEVINPPKPKLEECEATGTCTDIDPETKSKEWPHYFATENPLRTLRGVRVTKLLQEPQVVARVPLNISLTISEHVLKRFLIVKDTYLDILDANNNPYSRFRQKDILLALTLLEEANKKNHSEFAQYIDVLPSLEEMAPPESWTDEQLKAFEDRALSKIIKINIGKKTKVFESLVKANLLSPLSYQAFDWAYTLVRTRAIPFPSNVTGERSLGLALVPFVDMFNFADFPNHNCDRTTDDGFVEIVTRESTPPGPALLYHGPFSNTFLVTNLAVASEDNADEGYPLPLRPFPETDMLFHIKSSLWNASGPKDLIAILRPFEHPRMLIGFFRIFAMSVKDAISAPLFDQPYLMEEEDLALTGCLFRIKQEVDAFRTNLEQDIAELKRDDVIWTHEKLLALKYRVARKQIVRKNQCYCEKMKEENKRVGSEAKTEGSYRELYAKAKETAEKECFVAVKANVNTS